MPALPCARLDQRIAPFLSKLLAMLLCFAALHPVSIMLTDVGPQVWTDVLLSQLCYAFSQAVSTCKSMILGDSAVCLITALNCNNCQEL